MGTPAFAVPSLEILMDAGYPIAGIVTAPDKPGGRGLKQMITSPVKSFALEHGLKIMQPVNLKSREFIRELHSLHADLQIVVAFRMLPEVVWSMPGLGTMNLHGSLLPAYRGAAPIQWAIINGETVTGLTTFLLQHEIDTGAIIKQMEVPILPDDDAAQLHDRMSIKGAGLVLGSVDLLASGKVKLIQQDPAQVSHAPKIDHENARINWKLPAVSIHNLIRGMSPYPGAWTMLDEKELKIFVSRVSKNPETGIPGTIRLQNGRLFVMTGNGELEILELQLSGKRRMTVVDFLNGYRIKDWSMT